MRKWIRDRFGRGKKKESESPDSSSQQQSSRQKEAPELPHSEAPPPEPAPQPPARGLAPSAAEAAGATPITGQPSGRAGQRARSRRRGGRGRRGRGGQGEQAAGAGTPAPAAPGGRRGGPASGDRPAGSTLLPGESRGSRGGGGERAGGRGGRPEGSGRGEPRRGREVGRTESGRGEAGRPSGGQSRREREREREARRERGRMVHTGPAPLMPMYPDVVPARPPAIEPDAEQEPEAAVIREAPAQGERPVKGEGPPRGVVVLAIGLPGSGKTSWFRRRGVTPLSSDMMRHLLFDDMTEQKHQNLVFSTLRSMLRARLIVGMPTNYVDATNLSPNERRQWIQMAESFGYEVHGVFFDVPLELCIERNRKRHRNVPDEAMQRMAEKLVPPKFDEGFAKIIVVRVKQGEKEEAE